MIKINTLVLVVTFVLNDGFVYGQSQNFKDNWNFEIRKGVEKKFKQKLVLESSELLEDYDLYEIGSLETDQKGNLILFDYTNSYRIVYLPMGNLKEKRYIGEGKGNGPLEFGKPFDMKFDANGNIWLVDVEKFKIQKWSNKGELLKDIKAPKYVRPVKIGILDSLKYVAILSEQYTPSGVLFTFDFEGNLIKSFQKPENNEMRSILYFESEVIGTDDGLVIAGGVKPFLRKYEPSGKLIYSVGLLNFENPPQIISTKGRITSRVDDLIRATVDMQYKNDLLYVGVSGKMNDRWIREIDIYNPKNGDYISSLKLNYPARYFTILEDIIYVTEFNWEDRMVYLSKYRLSYD